MDNNENIFHLEVDPTAKGYMLETARWGKFLAILGFIGLGLIILVGLFAGTIFSAMSGVYGGTNPAAAIGPALFFVYLIIAAIYFYPVFALLKFSNLVKVAILSANQTKFNEALRYLKSMFKYIGIVTIIFLCLYGVFILFVIVGVAMR